MPDKRRHRGRHPADDQLFAESQHEGLRRAVTDYSWLLTRGYATDSALKLVGDRHELMARQRMAVRRSACSDFSLQRRAAKMTPIKEAAGNAVGIDGYNLLITVESALSGGLVLIGRDSCYRDLASVHGTYRKVEETIPAVEMIVDYVTAMCIPRIDWYLDRPVSNSGRLKALIADVIVRRIATKGPRAADSSPREQSMVPVSNRYPMAPAVRTTWNIELANSPDTVLYSFPGLVASSDSVVLDKCRAWLNLAAGIINARVPDAWKVDLRPGSDTTAGGRAN